MSDIRSTRNAPLDARFNNFNIYSYKKWSSDTPNKSQSAFIVEGDSFFDGRVNISGKLTVNDLIIEGGSGDGGINIPGGQDGYVMMSDSSSSMKWRKNYWNTNDIPTSITGPSDDIIYTDYKIGLGVTNPSEKLVINGNAEIDDIYIGNNNLDNSNIFSLKQYKNTDYYSIKIKDDNELNLNTSKSIKFNINDTNVGIIDNSGNFGIGITNPQENFHVGGNALIDGNLTVNGNLTTISSETVEIEDSMIFLAKNNQSDNVDFGLFGQYVENGTTKYTGIFRDADGDTGYFNFFHNLETKPTDTVDINDPSYEYGNLHVGGLKVDTGITFTSEDAFIYSDDIIFDASGITGTGYVGFGVTSSPEDSVDIQNGLIVRDGNIKIGITDSEASLHINRNDVIVIPVGDDSQRLDITGGIRYNTDNLSFEGYNGTNWGSLGGVKDVDGDTFITAENNPGNDNDELRFYTANQERMIIDSNGNIGINTTNSGTYNLEINGNIGVTGNIIPTINGVFNLGSTTHRWGDLFFGGETIYLGDSILKDNSGTFTVTGPAQIDELSITQSVDIDGNLNVSGTSDLNNLNVTENANINGNLDINGNTNITNDLYVTGDTNIKNNLNISGDTNILGAITASSINLSGSGDVTGDLNLSGDVYVGGTGNFNSLYVTSDVDIDGNLDVSGTLTLYDINVSNNINITNEAYINNLLYVTGNTNIQNDLVVEGNTQLDSLNVTNDVDIDGSLNVSGDLEIYDLYVSHNAYITNDLNVSGNTQLDSLNVSNDTNLNSSLNVTGASKYYGGINSYDIIRLYNEEDANLAGYIKTSNETTFNNKISIESNRGNGGIQFKTNPEGTLETAMFINAEGNIGIGITDQTEKLEVLGNTNLYGNLNVTGNTNVDGILNVSGNSHLGSLNVTGDTDIDGTLDVSGNSQLGSLNVSGNSQLSSLNVEGDTDIDGTINVAGDSIFYNLYVSNNAYITNDLYITGNSILQSNLQVNNINITNNLDIDGILDVSGNSQLYNVNVSTNLDVKNEINTNTLTVTSNSNLLGDLNVEGNLTVQGTTTTVNSEIVTIDDPLLELATNNTTNAVDIGFYGKYEKMHNLIPDLYITYYSGLARDATDGCYILFNTKTKPTTTIDTSAIDFEYACLKVNNISANSISITSSLDVGGDTNIKNLNITNNLNVDGYSSLYDLTITSNLDVSGNSYLGSLNVTGNTDIDGTLDVSGNSYLGSLNVTGNTDIDGTLDVSGNSYLGSLNVTGNTDIDGTLDVSGNSYLGSLNVTGNTDIDGTLDVSGNSYLGSLNVTGNTDIDGTLDVSGNSTLYNIYVTNNTTLQGTLNVTDSVIFSNTLYVSGDLSINDTLFVDASTDRVGINNSTPETVLHISGTDGLVLPVGDITQRKDVMGAIRYNTDSSSFEGYNGGTWGTLGGTKDVDGDTYISAENTPGSDNDQLKFYTASSEKMVVDTNGNVGIGITNPNNKLHVYSSDNHSYINIDRENTNSDSGIRFQDNGTDEWVFYSEGSTGDFLINEGTSENRLKIKAGGYLGIGVLNPSYPLDITGINNNTKSSLSLRNGNNVSTFSDGAQIRFGWNGSDEYAHFIHTRHNNEGVNNAIDFYVNDGTQNNTVTNGSIYCMTINDGNLGIGITNPAQKLDVIGNAYVSEFLGIGSNTISYPLQVETVNNNSWSTKLQNNNANLYALNTNGNALNIHSGISSTNNYLMKLRNNSFSDIFNVFNNGNVGINVATPSVKLDISAGLNDGAIIGESFIGNHLNTNNQFIISHKNLKDNSNDYAIKQNINGKTEINSNINEDLNMNINDSTKIIIKSDGKIGIHTTTPNENVEIKDNVLINTTSNISLTVTNTLSNIFIAHADGNGIHVNSGTTLNKALDLNENNNNLFSVYNNGNIVIGITQGDNLLSIENGLSILNNDDSLNINVTDNKNILQSDNEINFNISSNEVLNIEQNNINVNGSININGNLDYQELDVSGSAYISDSLYIGISESEFNLHVSGDTKLDGDVVIGGILSFEGVSVDGFEFQDSLIKFGTNNTDNTEDIGFYGKYVETGTTKYTGLFNDSSDNNIFKLFKDLESDPNTVVNTNDASFNYADLRLNNLDTIGNIGIGITNPLTSLHISSTNTLVIPVGDITQRIGVTGGIRYNSDLLSFEGYDGTNWGSLGGVKDVDQDTYISAENSPGSDNDELKFYTGGIEQMIIDSNGNIGIGITNPQYSLDVDGIIQSNDEIFAPEFTATSDIRVKENIKRFNGNFIEKISKLNLFEYNFTKEYSKNNEKMYGLIAQNVEKVIPEAIKLKKMKVNDNIIEDFKTISQNTLMTYLIGSIQQLTQSQKNLFNELINLKKDYNNLKYNYELEKELNNYKK